MENREMKELEELCRPVAEHLKKNYNPHCTVVITDSHIKLVRDEMGIPVRTAPEVPVQEQPKVTFEYFTECSSRIFLTNDKDVYNNLITQHECNIMLNPEINKFTTGYKCVPSSQSDEIYLVQIPSGK